MRDKIVIYCDGNMVIAQSTVTGNCIGLRFLPRGEPSFVNDDYKSLAREALDKLLNTEPEKPKYYNGKAVCINAHGGSDFTVGKTYEFKNGQTLDNSGDVHPNGYSIHNLGEWCRKAEYIFIPSIEE